MMFDDRVRPLLLAQAAKRNAAEWEADDAVQVIVSLLAKLDASDNARLREKIERKDAALRKARDTFNHYGELHAAKPDKVKADANYAMAATMHRALNPSP